MVENYTPDDFQNSITALTNKFDFHIYLDLKESSPK